MESKWLEGTIKKYAEGLGLNAEQIEDAIERFYSIIEDYIIDNAEALKDCKKPKPANSEVLDCF